MRKYYFSFIAFTLAACSSGSNYPNQKLIIDHEVSAMSRQEVINAINECESNNLRAVHITSKKKVEGRITDVVTDVTCGLKPPQSCK
jgi:uncharacterized protein YcfL